MKYLILIGDGMGDHPIAELDFQTPLQAARTPAMDDLCSRGKLLSASTVPDGFPPGSDVANMSLLGYDPATYYTGRAPLEAASMGVSLAENETAFRCNLVTLEFLSEDSVKMIDFSGGHISSAEAADIIESLQKHLGSELYQFFPGVSYRHLLVVKDSISQLDTVPPHDYIGKDVTQHWQTYLKSEQWGPLVKKAKEILADHPVNRKRREEGKKEVTSIWPWGSGKMPSMPTIPERFNIEGTMISAVDLLKGLGVCANLDIAQVEGATGYIDTNYEGKAQAAMDALLDQDLAFVHLEAPDEAGHQGRLDHKIKAIEDFDSRIVAPITKTLRERGEDFRAIVTMDHFTPLAIQTHTAEPIPVILYDSRENSPGSGLNFNEHQLTSEHHDNMVEGCKLIELLLTK